MTTPANTAEEELSATSLSPLPPPPATRTLTSHSSGPLVWIDCEMTGLSAATGDRILEIAVVVTDGNLEPLDQGINYVIRQTKEVMDGMGEWCVKQHGQSGLTAQCLDPEVARDHTDVRAAVLAYVKDRVPKEKQAVLAGNTVHADAVFLKLEMPELMNHLHYRILDVSSIKELVYRWYGSSSELAWQGSDKSRKGAHRALEDIRASIEELKWYREKVFVSPAVAKQG